MSETYLRLWEETGSVLVVQSDEHSIDAAVSHWLETHRDGLLHLTLASGDRYVTRASNILCWLISTPQGRALAAEMEKAANDEDRANRIAVGLPWDEDA